MKTLVNKAMKTPLYITAAALFFFAMITPVAIADTGPNDGPVEASETAAVKMTIPAGTPILIRTNSTLNTGMNIAGTYFPASLAADIVVDGQVVIPRGTFVQGYVRDAVRAGSIGRRAQLKIELSDISYGDFLVPIHTEYKSSSGEDSGTGEKTGAGAAIGGILGGWSGVAKGAAIGLGVSAISKGKQIEIPTGALMEFRLQDPVQLEIIN